jgi:hypothetical protein
MELYTPMYRYDSASERLLLQSFKEVLIDEFKEGQLGTFMRNNTCITQVLVLLLLYII